MDRVLAIDIGAHTQDILLWEEGEEPENCFKLVLPSQTELVAGRIREATRRRLDIFLCGDLMGGGPCTAAVRDHLAQQLGVFATTAAALTLHDNLDRVRAMGVVLTEEAPVKTCKIGMRDLDLPALKLALKLFDLDMPAAVAVAVQDHGFCPTGSNRVYRFNIWEEFLKHGQLKEILYDVPPRDLTRMEAIKRLLPRAYVMDTCAAAIRGALCDPCVADRAKDGAILVNVGNQHTVAALVRGTRVLGLFEHHTDCLDGAALASWIERFARQEAKSDEVLEDGGHGCGYAADAAGSFPFVSVTGPRRSVAPPEWYRAVPYGDTMLVGCFGLLAALREKSPPHRSV